MTFVQNLDNFSTEWDEGSEEIGYMAKLIWTHEEVQQYLTEGGPVQMEINLTYFMGNLDRVASKEYWPTQDDILRARQRTTGVHKFSFTIRNMKFTIIDVGGQRNERRKWISHFDDVQAILFVVSLGEYDEKLLEDHVTNRMSESLKLFGEVCTCPFFETTSIILFLNKRDIFESKLEQKIPLTIAFPEYSGGFEYKNAVEYVKQKYLSVFERSRQQGLRSVEETARGGGGGGGGKGGSPRHTARYHRESHRAASMVGIDMCYTHVTCATDRDSAKFVFNSVINMIIRQQLSASGMIA